MNLSLTLNDTPSLSGGITIKSPQELDSMRQAGQVVAETVAMLVRSVERGMRTKDLDAIASQHIARLGAKPSFKGYRGFPATICTSINEQIVHGIPGNRVIQDGDIVSMDVGAIVDGYHADSAVTVSVGNVTPAAQRLVTATRTSLEKGIRQARAGNRVGDISQAVQEYAESLGYGVVREYVGHGIGRALHEEPSVPNFGEPGKGHLLRTGMVIAIEPMLNIGGWGTRSLTDKWTVVTADGSLSAHFEHTVAIQEDGPEVLTAVQ
ncbi:MAG: type I methionyl aminopeptidase [Chloroflexi bacterium]|nr:type I methionyl aminopeptidase [Chloroflexota bacterium]